MKLTINGQDVDLVYSFRSAIYFEQITGHNIDFSNLNANDLLNLFYCVCIASLQKAKLPIISMLDFLDVIDEHGGDMCIVNFSNWYIDIMRKEFELLESAQSEDEPKKQPKGKKNKV